MNQTSSPPLRPRYFHKFLVVLCLLYSILPMPLVTGQTDVYFIGVNDVLISMNSSTQPIWVDGMICLPYTVFDSGSTGSNLGLSSSYQRSSNLVTVYHSQGTLIFDIDGESCINGSTGDTYPYRAVLRNSVPYLPMTAICNFFQLSFSYHNTAHGYLVHLSDGNGSLNSRGFLLYYDDQMNSMAQAYHSSSQPSTTPSVEQTPVSTPLVLGIALTEESLDFTETLDNWKVPAVFFFTQDQLEQQGNYLRKLYGMGHSLGIALTAHTWENLQMELKACNELLAQQAYSQSVLLLLPSSVDSATKEALSSQGYHLWQGNTPRDITDPVSTANSLRQGTAAVYLTVYQSETTASHWAQLMNSLGERQFVPHIPKDFF